MERAKYSGDSARGEIYARVRVACACERGDERNKRRGQREDGETSGGDGGRGYESHERLSHCKHARNRDSSRLTCLRISDARPPADARATQVPVRGSG